MARKTVIRFSHLGIPEFLGSLGIEDLVATVTKIEMPADRVRVMHQPEQFVIEDRAKNMHYFVPMHNVRYYYTIND